MAFLACNAPLSDESDIDQWNAAIAAGELFVRTDCSFQAGIDREDQTQEVGACVVTVTTRTTATLTFNDPAETPNYDVHRFWSYFKQYGKNYFLAYFLCDGTVYGFRRIKYISANPQIENTNNGLRQWSGTITWDEPISGEAAPIAPAIGATIDLAGLDLNGISAPLVVNRGGNLVPDGATLNLGQVSTGTVISNFTLFNKSPFVVLGITSTTSSNTDAVPAFGTPSINPLGSALGAITLNGAVGLHSALITVQGNIAGGDYSFIINWEIV